MTEFDLSRFKSTFSRDTAEDLTELANAKSIRRISEGSHEVVVVGLHNKEGELPVTLSDKDGGRLGINLVVRNVQQAEQMIYLAIPIAQTFKQVCATLEKNAGFVYRNTIKNLNAFSIDANTLRESLIESNGKSAELLIGAQVVVNNSWPTNKLHLEYDNQSRQFFFETSSGGRFDEGNLGGPIALDLTKPIKERYSEAVALADEQGYKLALQMETVLSTHPTADNTAINDKLQSSIKSKSVTGSAISAINKTKPVFTGIVPKKISVPV